ncbi:hypothetical protein F1C10_11625 [Sphingomonas sp. NBWT7]|uniref:hypothetical protein n=1 Tax=Sphingomonas sp. NBWT7 TaxID=2596913 RepID=UPI001623539E|nr:hypothetical protein [Sphingomonas sp. NBWT7]QNE32532.1 hypothetical protein F1C10_11625 [Sphingomonas sp. NBWT7]
MASDNEWISASDALEMVEGRLGGRAIAKDTLAEMLRDGKLRARAAEAWGADHVDMNASWESATGEPADHDPEEEVQSDFRQSVRWADDVDSWIWPESFFIVTISLKPREFIYYKGVSFFKDDLEQPANPETLTKSSPTKGGRRTDFYRWEAFWLEVIQIARDGNLVPGQIRSQAALREDIIAAMGDNALSEDSIKEPVRRIWNRFCEL